MRAFITGITGFAGQHLAEHLLDCGDVLLGCSRSGKVADDQRLRTIRWDIGEPIAAATFEIVRDFQPDCIYHLAAISIPADCGAEEPTAQAMAANVDGTRHVVDVASRLNARLVFVSSSYVYGAVTPDNYVIDETSPLAPHRAYGMTKQLAEEIVLEAHANGEVDAVIARAFAHTGPGQVARMMLPEWCEQVARGVNPLQVQSLDSHFDLSDVRDVVRSYRLLALHGLAGEAYNVGSGRSTDTGDVFDILRRMVSLDLRAVESSPGKRQHAIANIDKLVSTTDWQPAITLEQTIHDTLDYWNTEQRR